LVYLGEADPKMVYDSVYGGKATPGFDSGKLSASATDALLANSTVSNAKTQFSTYSAYLSDVISFDRIGLAAMASLRIDYFDTKGNVTNEKDDYTQTALSPKLGLVYMPIKDKVSVFANYMNGFKNVAPVQVADLDGTNVRTQTFEPEQAIQTEFGIKTNLLDNRITSSFSYYNIQVGNKVMPDPENVNNSIQGGEVESKGFELDLNASPVKGLDLLLGYAHNESTVLRAKVGDVFSPVGRRPGEAGPEHLFNTWATYRISGDNRLNGLGIGFGANAASERLIMDSEATGTFALPAYTVFNGSVFYNAPNYRLILKVDNLTNKEYYKGWTTINPQRPRSVSASFSYLF
jgi:iron complex outermembrane recepter protein